MTPVIEFLIIVTVVPTVLFVGTMLTLGMFKK